MIGQEKRIGIKRAGELKNLEVEENRKLKRE